MMDEVKEETSPLVAEENPILESETLPSGSRGDEGILEGVAITDNMEEAYSSESDEGEEGIIIHAGRTTSQKRAPRKSFGKAFNNYTRPDALSPQHTSSGLSSNRENVSAASNNIDEELKKLRFLRHATAFDVDINALEDHPWRSKTVDLLDYFNYGFNERTWMQYCEKQLRLRSQKGLGPYVAPAASTTAGSSTVAVPLPPVVSGPPGFIPPQFQTAPFVPPAAPAAPQMFNAPPPAPPSLAQFQASSVPAPVFEVPPPVMAKPAMAPPAAPVAPPTAPAGIHMQQGFMPPPPLPGGRPGPPPGAFANPSPSVQVNPMGAMAPPGPPQAPQAPSAPQAPNAPPSAPSAPQGGPPGAFPPHPTNFMGFNPMNHMGMAQGGPNMPPGMGNMFMHGHMGMEGSNFMGHQMHTGMGAMGMHGMNTMRPGFDMYGREIGGNDRGGNDWGNDRNTEWNNDNGNNDMDNNERVGRDPTASLDDRFPGPDRDRERDRDRAGRDPRYESHRDRRDPSEEQSGKRKHASNEDLEGSSKRRASSRDRDRDRDRDDRGRGDGRDSRAPESSKPSRDERSRRDSRDRDEGRSSRRSSSRDRDRDRDRERRDGHSGSSKRSDKDRDKDRDRDRDRERERSERPSDRSSGKDRERSPDRRARRFGPTVVASFHSKPGQSLLILNSTVMSQAPNSNSRPKVEDNKRIQKILDELSAKYSDRKNGMQQVAMDEKAKQMFMEYANELTVSVLEASSILAQHRNSKTIDVEDVALILGKRLGIELPGLAALKQQGPGTDAVSSAEATPSSGATPLATDVNAAHNR